MSRLLITIALSLCFSTAGARTIELIERAVELTLGDITLPTSEGGTVSFKDCPSCGYSTHRTTDATVFLANGQALPLSDFLRVANEIRGQGNEDDAIVTVFLDIASDRVTRVAMHF